MTQSLATVVVPFDGQWADDVNHLLDALGSPAGPQFADARSRLEAADGGPFVHFLSMVVIPPESAAAEAHLVIEASADGHAQEVLWRLAEAIPDPLRDVLEVTRVAIAPYQPLGRFLCDHSLPVDPALTPAGLAFCGTPDLSVERILGEARLACRIRELLDEMPPDSAFLKLQAVRARLFREVEFKWAFVPEPVTLALGPGRPWSLVTVAWHAFGDFFWPLACAPLAVFLLFWLQAGRSPVDALWPATAALAFELVAAVVIAALAYFILRRQERADVPLDIARPQVEMDEILAREDRPGVAQNHLAAVSVMKPGWVRDATMRLALWLIRERASSAAQPGFLDRIGSIHFARWLRLPGTQQLIFFSNYDGSWQGYLEDFIARLREGLTSVWSNTRDFPKTENLVKGGAGDGPRFKRWARRQQLPTRFWYTAYPELGTHRIRANAAIRHGFANASNEEEAIEWLSRFGYAGRDSLEAREIPTLAFGGLRRLPYARFLVIGLPEGEAAARWLGAVKGRIAYGDRMPKESAVVVGFTAAGLRKLGLEERSLHTFPTAFQQGMCHPIRARALGDRPEAWEWGAQSTDAVLLLYNRSEAGLAACVASETKLLEGYGCRILHEVAAAKLVENFREPFGFRDGISQPAMRGTVRGSRETNGLNALNPGELVLGYRDNLDMVAPCPQLNGRDIGRNGTFLVVRQLEQDPDAFWEYVSKVADDLIARDDPKAPTRDQALLAEWIAAKMVGRWKDGTSLVRHPNEPGNRQGDPAMPGSERKVRPDNAFLFGREDPDGLRCPFGAHVRRANPRESFEPGSRTQIDITNRHRILRVGRAYEAAGERGKPGLMFMCVNADIERQFEFLQQSWILGSAFHGLDGEVDPIMGCGERGMLVPTPHGPLKLAGLRDFVRTLGGAYFFMPSRQVVELLSNGREDPAWRSQLPARPGAPALLAREAAPKQAAY